MRLRLIVSTLSLLTCAGFIACGGSGSSVTDPNLSISSISPDSIPAGSNGFSLSLSGQGLSAASSVHFGNDVLSPSVPGTPCASSSNCQTIAVSIPAKDVSNAGAVKVFVSNSASNSNTVVFTVTQPSPSAPEILTFLPTVAPAGGAGFTMVIIGLNVASGAIVNFGSQSLTPASLLACNAGEICPALVQVPASAIVTAGPISLSLTNPGGATSSPQPFLVLATNTFPIQESINNSTPPLSANGSSTHSSVSGGAGFVVFDSTASNLVSGTTAGHSQVYLRTNCFTGQPNCVPQTTLISAAADSSAGSGGVAGSDKPVISVDGRFVAFESDDTNLIAEMSAATEQIYLRDTCNSILGPIPACTPATTLISASSTGAPGNAPSLNPSIGAFGFFIAFQSTATNLGSASVPPGVSQIYLSRQCPPLPVADQIPSCTPSLTLASFDASSNPGNRDSANPSLDPIGFVLSFQSLADNIVPATVNNGFQQIYARNTCFLLSFPGLTLPCPNATIAVSVDANGQLGTGDSVSPSTDFGGIDLAYATRAGNITVAAASNQQVIAATTCILEQSAQLACSLQNSLVVSVDQNGVPGQGDSFNPAIGAGKIAFTSQANLLANVSGQQIYAATPCLLSGGACTVKLVSADASGNPTGGDFATMEGSGAFVTFSATGSPLATAAPEIFLNDPFF
jgi:hypothetical protein